MDEPTAAASFYSSAQRALDDGASPAELGDELERLWTERYRMQTAGVTELVTFEHGGAKYLFDKAEVYDRSIAAVGFAETPLAPRNRGYQAGFPLKADPERPVDRGHMIPSSAGGLYGPNLFRQDRALNRGWSDEGKAYRKIESFAVSHHSFFFCALVYCDDTDFPALIELGKVYERRLEVTLFRNRFDVYTEEVAT